MFISFIFKFFISSSSNIYYYIIKYILNNEVLQIYINNIFIVTVTVINITIGEGGDGLKSFVYFLRKFVDFFYKYFKSILLLREFLEQCKKIERNFTSSLRKEVDFIFLKKNKENKY